MVWGRQRSASSPSRLYCSSFLVSVLNFATSPNSGVKLLGGFLRSEKTFFRFISSGGASFSWFCIFLLLRSRDASHHRPASQDQIDQIQHQIQKYIDAGLAEEYKHRDYPRHCSTCFLVSKPGSTAMHLVADYGEVNKKSQNHSGGIPIMENTLERIAKCRFKTKMEKRSGFWHVDVTRAAQELLAFVTPKGRVFRWKVMPFGVASAPALFQELMNKILYILGCRPLVQELVSRGAEMEVHIDDVSLGTNTKEDHILLLREFFTVCQESHLSIKLEKCEFMRDGMAYLGFDVGYGWWKPAASKMQPMQDMQIRDDPKKGLHDVRIFIGACNLYRRHIHNFTYSSAPLTALIRKTNPW